MQLLFLAGVVLALLSAATLLAKSEFFRGLGRIIQGVAWMDIGAVFTALGFSSHADPYSFGIGGIVLTIVGLVTVGSGVHKFRRRNLPQGATPVKSKIYH